MGKLIKNYQLSWKSLANRHPAWYDKRDGASPTGTNHARQKETVPLMKDDFVQLMERLAPELVSEIALRALVLERVSVMGPVGRRQLAERLRLPEREIRGAAMSLRDYGLIRLTSAGMVVTDMAVEWLPAAQEFSRAMRGLADMQNQLMVLLGVEMVYIVAGDADQDERVLQDVHLRRPGRNGSAPTD